MGKVGKTVTGVGVVGVGIAAYLFLNGGFGGGNGFLPGGTGGSTQSAQEASVSMETTEEIPDAIIVHISETDVTINGNTVTNEEELRDYIENYNSDARTFILEDEHSILETYEWVTGTFKDMGVTLSGAE